VADTGAATAPGKPLAPGPSAAATEAPTVNRSGVLIELRRVPGGFGGPDFTETIDGNGRGTFKGTWNSVCQDWAGVVDHAAVAELLATIRRNGFFGLKDAYGEPLQGGCLTDAPTDDLSVTLDGRTKSVEHYLGCPRGSAPDWLDGFGERIESIVSHAQQIVRHAPPDAGPCPGVSIPRP
jgi:hypothetical protein